LLVLGPERRSIPIESVEEAFRVPIEFRPIVVKMSRDRISHALLEAATEERCHDVVERLALGK
jgi:hypothetical protein